ncbi:MAG: hypothetical protein AAGG01_05050 [Planctomycetota bacterium]
MNRESGWRRAKSAAKEAAEDRLEAIRLERDARRRAFEAISPEKNWKLLYIRSNKLARARQLGFDYPRRSKLQFLDDHGVDAS